jgi:uncharacterized protein
MSKLRQVARALIGGALALLVTTALSAAQDTERPLKQTQKRLGVTQRGAANKPAKPTATAQPKKQSALALAAQAAAEQKEHRLILQVNTNDAAAMNQALNNAKNVADYYKETGETVQIAVVAFGPGLNMLRDDTSPVKARIETMALATPEISYKACGNTRENMHKAESKDIPIIPQAEVVKSGVVHIMQLEEQGWTYVKP